MRNHPGEKITPDIVADLFNKAFGRTATIEKATKGFEVTGIFPVNPDVFSAEDFAPAENLQSTNLYKPTNKHIENNRRDERKEVKGEQRMNVDTIQDEIRQNLSFEEIIPIPGCSFHGEKEKKVIKSNTPKYLPPLL